MHSKSWPQTPGYDTCLQAETQSRHSCSTCFLSKCALPCLVAHRKLELNQHLLHGDMHQQLQYTALRMSQEDLLSAGHRAIRGLCRSAQSA